jgi:hypothetical protein
MTRTENPEQREASGIDDAHTPTPWAVGWYQDPTGIVPLSLAIWPASHPEGAIGDAICLLTPIRQITERDEANADFIVKATSAHGERDLILTELVAALVGANEVINALFPGVRHLAVDVAMLNRNCLAINAALAKVAP